MKKVLFIFIVFLGCLWAQEKAKVEKTEIVFIGSLTKNKPLGLMNPGEYCLEDGYIYKGADYRIGKTNIYTENAEDLSSLEGKIVVIYGKMVTDLNKILVKGKKAPEDYGLMESSYQLRSDWVTEETGFSIGRSTHERLKNFSYLHYSKIEEFQGVLMTQDNSEITVKFTNTIAEKIDNLEILAHYESVQGKPVPHYIVNSVQTLHKGQSVSLTFPTHYSIETRQGKEKQAQFHSIGINTYQNGLTVDIKLN